MANDRRLFGLTRLVLEAAAVASLVLIASGCSGSSTHLNDKAATLAWNQGLMNRPLPAAGCFEARFPQTAWSRVACSSSDERASAESTRGLMEPGIELTGSGRIVAQTSQNISEAIASFPSVAGIRSVYTEGGHDAHLGPNSYGLQLNTVPFSTAACGNLQNCKAWVQFVFSNYGPGKGASRLGIQEFLLQENHAHFRTCPPNEGWHRMSNGACIQNHHAMDVPNVPIARLTDLRLTGIATAASDGIILTVGRTMYGKRDDQSDAITDLSQHWQAAEFNVFGNAGSSRVVFNPGATVTVNLQVNTGSNAAPACVRARAVTGETNNLWPVAAPSAPQQQRYPSISFTESTDGGPNASANGGRPPCTALPGSAP